MQLSIGAVIPCINFLSISLWNLDLSFASCTSCTSAMHDITHTQLWGMCFIGKEEDETFISVSRIEYGSIYLLPIYCSVQLYCTFVLCVVVQNSFRVFPVTIMHSCDNFLSSSYMQCINIVSKIFSRSKWRTLFFFSSSSRSLMTMLFYLLVLANYKDSLLTDNIKWRRRSVYAYCSMWVICVHILQCKL